METEQCNSKWFVSTTVRQNEMKTHWTGWDENVPKFIDFSKSVLRRFIILNPYVRNEESLKLIL